MALSELPTAFDAEKLGRLYWVGLTCWYVGSFRTVGIRYLVGAWAKNFDNPG